MAYRASIICVFNNKEVLEKQLLLSLKKQIGEFEIICVDNTNKKFQSAASALNYGVKLSTTDVLIFAHQDIYLKSDNEIEKFVNYIEQSKCGNIYGSSGAKEKVKVNIGVYSSGESYDNRIKHVEWNKIEVSSLDESFFGMKKGTYEKHPFDEKICDDWHLYCVEACLHARKNGHKIFVVPVQLHHFSKGKVSWNYMKCLKTLAAYYRKDFKFIWTTVYKIYTNPIYINCLTIIWYINRRIRGRL